MSASIQWTETTFNVMTGCTKVSRGCFNCYAKRHAEKLQTDRNPRTAMKYANGFRFTVHYRALDELEQKLRSWKKPHKIFINSMSDTFHEEAPEEFIQQLFTIMGKYSGHIFQVLTKRASRMAGVTTGWTWPGNVWAGVTVESSQYLNRMNYLRSVPAKVRWISFEPLLGPIPKIDLTGIHWVVVGGESGPNPRKMNPQWARGIRDQCGRAGVPFFFKQMGGEGPDKGGDLLDCVRQKEFPDQEVAAFSQSQQLNIPFD